MPGVSGTGSDANTRSNARVSPGQHLGDGVDTVPADEPGEDPLYDRSCLGVGLQSVGPLAVRGLGRVRVRTCVGERVTAWWPAAEEAAFDLGLCGHAGADADLDPFRSPSLLPPNTDMTRSWASLPGSMGPPTSGTHSEPMTRTPPTSGKEPSCRIPRQRHAVASEFLSRICHEHFVKAAAKCDGDRFGLGASYSVAAVELSGPAGLREMAPVAATLPAAEYGGYGAWPAHWRRARSASRLGWRAHAGGLANLAAAIHGRHAHLVAGRAIGRRAARAGLGPAAPLTRPATLRPLAAALAGIMGYMGVGASISEVAAAPHA